VDNEGLKHFIDKIPTSDTPPPRRLGATSRTGSKSANVRVEESLLNDRYRLITPDGSALSPEYQRRNGIGFWAGTVDEPLERALDIHSSLITEYDKLTNKRELLKAAILSYEQMMLTDKKRDFTIRVMSSRTDRFSEEHRGFNAAELQQALAGESPSVKCVLSKDDITILYRIMAEGIYIPLTTFTDKEFKCLEKITKLYETFVRGLPDGLNEPSEVLK
jgi:hypothetical protein